MHCIPEQQSGLNTCKIDNGSLTCISELVKVKKKTDGSGLGFRFRICVSARAMVRVKYSLVQTKLETNYNVHNTLA